MITLLKEFTSALRDLNTKIRSPMIDKDLIKLQAWLKPQILDPKALKRLGDLLQIVGTNCTIAMGMSKDVSNKEFLDIMGMLDGVRAAVVKQHKDLKAQGISYAEITEAFEILQLDFTNGLDYWVRFRDPDQSLQRLMSSTQKFSKLLEMLKTVSREDTE